MNEIIFVVEEAAEGGFVAKAVGETIVTEVDELDRLPEMVRDAVRCHFDPKDLPKLIRLHYVREQVVPV